MPSTNFVVTSLTAYVQQNKDLLLKNFALVGIATRKRIGIQTGIKKDAYINYLDMQPVLADGADCAFSAAGTATLTQRTISTAPIRVNMEICADKVRGYYAEYLIRVNAEDNGLPFEEYVMQGIINNINKKIEKLIWQGDTTSSSTDLKWIDGFIKLAGADSSVVDVSIASGKSAYEGLKAVVTAIPEEALEKGAVIFVSPSIFRAFCGDLLDLNYYHINPNDATLDEVYFPATNVKVVKTAGLAANLNVLATFPENLIYGCDMEGDAEQIKLLWKEDSEMYQLVARWNSGVQMAFPDQVVLGTFAAAPVALTAVWQSVAGINTQVTGINAVAADVHNATDHAINTKAVQ